MTSPRHDARTDAHQPTSASTCDRGSVAAETAIAIPVLVAVLLFAALLIGRGVDARLRIDDAASQAARAASIARTPTAAAAAATQTVDHALAGASAECPHPATTVDTSQFRPGGIVTVTIRCHLDLSQAALLGVPVNKTLTATAASPIDTFRAAPALAQSDRPSVGGLP